MRSNYTLNPALVDEDFKKKNSHLGRYYHDIGFRNSREPITHKGKGTGTVQMGYLIVGSNEIGVTRGQATRIGGELYESLYSHIGYSRDHKPGTVQTPDLVPILHQDHNLTVAEINKIREVLVDAVKVFDMSSKLAI